MTQSRQMRLALGLGECTRFSELEQGQHVAPRGRKEDQQTSRPTAAPTDLLTLCGAPQKWIRSSHVGSLPRPTGGREYVQCSHEGQWHLHGRGAAGSWLLTLPTWADAPSALACEGLLSGAGAYSCSGQKGGMQGPWARPRCRGETRF